MFFNSLIKLHISSGRRPSITQPNGNVLKGQRLGENDNNTTPGKGNIKQTPAKPQRRSLAGVSFLKTHGYISHCSQVAIRSSKVFTFDLACTSAIWASTAAS